MVAIFGAVEPFANSTFCMFIHVFWSTSSFDKKCSGTYDFTNSNQWVGVYGRLNQHGLSGSERPGSAEFISVLWGNIRLYRMEGGIV